MTAKMLTTNEALQDLNHRIKKEQQQLHRKLLAHARMVEIVKLKKSNAPVYRQKYVVLRQELLKSDKDLRDLHQDIMRLEAELVRRLDRIPAVINLRKRIAVVEQQLAVLPK